MICDLCDDKASVFLTQIVDGQMQKVNLCEGCAKDKGVTDPTGFALADLLLGFGAESDVEKQASAPKKGAGAKVRGNKQTVCHTCGFTHSQFKKAGRLGCPKCYKILGPGLESLLKAMHKGTQHIGKIPARHHALLEHHHRLDDLKTQLHEAVGREAFEDAAQIRDQILKIEAELQSLEAASQSPEPPAEVGR